MRKENHHFSVFFIWLVLLCIALFILPVCAQDEDYVPYEPITKVDLGVSSLNLAVGESYTFHVTYEPEYTTLTSLDWYVTDENVIAVDPQSFTVTALKDGEARIFAESIDQISYAVCNVTVGTSSAKDGAVMKSGTDYLGLSQKDLRKITAPTLVRYLDFVADSALDDADFDSLSSRAYDVLAIVRPGTEEAESRKAAELGINSEPLTNLQSVTLQGTLKQILAFVKDNSDLVKVFELENVWIDEPDPDPAEEELSSKTILNKFNLQGYSDELSNITSAHNVGLTGHGRNIAIIDTGFMSSHEQFKDANGKGNRFIKEACFSTTSKIGLNNFYSACTDGKIDDGNGASLDLSKAIRKKDFNHGTHVAGIAAGRDGVAPDANIIGVQAASEMRWTCSSKEIKYYRCSQNSNQCCSARFTSSNQARAYNYLIGLAKSGVKIDVVNMSYGGPKKDGTGYTGICDSLDQSRKTYLDKLIAAGILPVVSAGNDKFDDAVGMPACLSNAYTVAALSDFPRPYIASYSDYNKTNIDIAAPGTQIYSSVAIKIDKNTGAVTCMKNCYDHFNGTSMAAPMTSGSIVLVRQLYPGMSAQDAGRFLKNITAKTVNQRMSYDHKKITQLACTKPVLNLKNILGKFTIADKNVTAEGQKAKITFYDTVFDASVNVRVYDIVDKKWMRDIKFDHYTDGKYNYTVEINGNGHFIEGRVYRVEIARTITKGPSAKIVKYIQPFPSSPTLSRTLTAASRGNGADLNVYMRPEEQKNRIAYNIYNADTGTFVKSVDADYSHRGQTVSGLVNGQKYYVTAQFYREVKVNKRIVRVYGTESEKVWFMPMSDPFKCSYGAGVSSTSITCAEDPDADGIIVIYRSTDEDQLKPPEGIISKKGKFTVEIEDPAILKGQYQFVVMKYKEDDGWGWPSSGSIVNRPPDYSLKKKKIYPLINASDKDNIVISNSENGISVMLMDFKTSDIFSRFCESSESSCSGKLSETDDKFFLVMNHVTNAKGKKMYTPGYFVSNIWGSN